MDLADFLSTASRAVPAPTRTVKFKLIGSGSDSTRVIVDATAELAFLDDAERLEALRAAADYVKKTYKGEEPVMSRRYDEEMYFILRRALRRTDDISEPIARTELELRNALVLPEALRLWDEYQRFVREEFPPDYSEEETRELVEEAKKKSLIALLSERGSGPIRAAWASLVVASGEYQQPTSSDIAPSESP